MDALKRKITPAVNLAKDVSKAVIKAPGKVVDFAIKRNKEVTDARENKNYKMMVENFGSPKKYQDTLKPMKAPAVMNAKRQRPGL